MKHELKLTLEPLDLVALSQGQAIALTIGDQIVMLHAEQNGHVGRGKWKRPATGKGTNICGYCKRDLTLKKHSKGCRVLRSMAVQKGLKRLKEEKK